MGMTLWQLGEVAEEDTGIHAQEGIHIKVAHGKRQAGHASQIISDQPQAARICKREYTGQ